MDITDTPDLGALRYSEAAKTTTVTYPKKPAHNATLGPLMKDLSKKNLRKNLEKFTSFHTRYYKSEYGAKSSAWLYGKVNETIHGSGAGKHGARVKSFEHPWGQSSVIATIPGRSDKTVVIGAHQDSINLFLPSILAAPGADDDGSGTVTILEALRVLLESEAVVQGNASNTIEFHWYSAEEGGLLGSQAIFSAYEKQGRDVKAMLQQDMTGYVQKTVDAGEPVSVGVITDYVNPALTEFIKEVIGEVRLDKQQTIPFADLMPVLRYSVCLDEVRICLLGSCFCFESGLSFGFRNRVRFQIFRQQDPHHRRQDRVLEF